MKEKKQDEHKQPQKGIATWYPGVGYRMTPPNEAEKRNAKATIHQASSKKEEPPQKENSQKPVYKRWWFWFIIGYLLLGFIVTIIIDQYEKREKIDTPGVTSNAETEEKPNTDTSNQIGSSNNPYILNAEDWYSDHREGNTPINYIGKWVKVSGTVLSISDYGDLKGYYLAGGKGKGLVCWVYGDSVSVQCGQLLEYLGQVSVEDFTQIEINEGQIVSVSWPINKAKSPITISDWTWTRDSFGGVEWNFRLTNNTDKVVKYVTMEWDCYNAVGDLVYDDFNRKPSYSIKYTGPLESGETTDLLRNTTLFYNHAYDSSKLTQLQVEFMDGTIIFVNSKGYIDIVNETSK